MDLSDVIPPPAWVEKGARQSGGVDLLGLRLPVQAIGNRLLNGITTITPTARYHSIRAWLLHSYLNAEPRRPDRLEDFRDYAARAEAAIAYGNLLIGTPVLATVVGRDKARPRVRENPSVYVLEKLTEQAAVTAYAQPAEQLHLTRGEGNGVPTLGEEWGVPLALAADASLGVTALGRRLRAGKPLEKATRAEIEEFGNAAWLDAVPTPERDALLAAVLPDSPIDEFERNRIATYATLLSLADLDTEPDEAGVFEEAVRPTRRLDAKLTGVLDGWLLYAVRDTIAVTAEFTLEQVRRTLADLDPRGASARESDVINALLEDSLPESRRLLREFGLAEGRSPERTSLARLTEAVHGRTRVRARSGGAARWSGDLVDDTLTRHADESPSAAALLGVLSWLLAERRAGEVVREREPVAAQLSQEGATRFGMAQVVLPRLDDWRRQNASVLEAMAFYVGMVVDQHLQIVWGRLAADPDRDVSVLVRDGDRLARKGEFQPGRTAARLAQAIWWLQQLDLIDEGGLRPEGKRALARALRTLEVE